MFMLDIERSVLMARSALLDIERSMSMEAQFAVEHTLPDTEQSMSMAAGHRTVFVHGDIEWSVLMLDIGRSMFMASSSLLNIERSMSMPMAAFCYSCSTLCPWQHSVLMYMRC